MIMSVTMLKLLIFNFWSCVLFWTFCYYYIEIAGLVIYFVVSLARRMKNIWTQTVMYGSAQDHE